MLLQELKQGMQYKQSRRGNHPAKEEEDARTRRAMETTALKSSLKMTKDLRLKTPRLRNQKVVKEVPKREAQ